MEKAEKIVQIEDVGYYYFFREDSIINETYSIRRLDALEARYQRMNYLKVKAIYKDIPIDKNDIKEYTKKEKIWFSISKISLDLVCRIRNKFGYGVE